MVLFKKPEDYHAKYRYVLTNYLSFRDGGFYCKIEKRRFLFNRFRIGWTLMWDGYYRDYSEAINDLKENLDRLEKRGVINDDSISY